MMRILLLALWCLAAVSGPAHAGFIVTAISAVTSWLTAAIGSAAIAGWLVKTAISVGLSKLAQAIRGKPRSPGIVTEVTTTGGTTPQKFILGRYATSGHLLAPPMSYGQDGKTPRAYLVYAIALSALPGATLSRVIINDDYVTLGAAEAAWGRGVTGDLADKCWIDYLDGSQTAAHPDLLAAIGSDPDRPWTADMVGPGTCYAVARFKYDREAFNGLPSVRFEMLGLPLYDPRADSTVGGSGAQRWADPATWTQTENPIVVIYNLLRGITLPDGDVWGGECTAEDLPLASWFAAMNECDVLVVAQGGGTEPQYRGGYEVSVDDEPASVIEELLKACSGQLVEIGGVWKVQVGPPPLPVYFFTDDDVLISRDQTLDPFPGLDATWNGVSATYPEPASLWESKDAPPRYDATWEAADGGRRRVAALQLPCCPYAGQVQRLMASYIADERRFRQHQITLPPDALVLEPLDTLSWTSTANGYMGKLFEVSGMVDSVMTLCQALRMRERDPADYSWSSGDYLATSIALPGTTPPAAQSVPGWAVSAWVLSDATAVARRPALRLEWDIDGADDAAGIRWEVRLAGGTDPVLTGSLGSLAAGWTAVADGIISGEAYEVRAQLIADRATSWTAWTAVTAPVVLLSAPDVSTGAISRTVILEATGGPAVSATSAPGDSRGSMVDCAGVFLPFEGSGYIAKNPIRIDISARVYATTVPAKIYFVPQARESGLYWRNLDSLVLKFDHIVPSGMAGSSYEQMVSLTGYLLAGEAPDLWDKVRLMAYVEAASPFSGRSVSTGQILMTLTQINR